MNEQQRKTAQFCKSGAEDNTMTFPEIVGQLMQAGFERYVVDFCKATITYYLPDGDNFALESPKEEVTIPSEFNTSAIQSAIKEAQLNVPGYSYKGFRKKVMTAGCVGYTVSFIGKRAVYYGRTAETHVEYFPEK